MPITVSRIFSVLFTLGVVTSVGGALEWVGLALFSAHYVVALIASFPRIRQRVLSGHPGLFLPMAIGSASAAVYLFALPPWILCFGLHHVLSETQSNGLRGFRTARALTEAFFYFTLLRNHPWVANLIPSAGGWLALGTLISLWDLASLRGLPKSLRRDLVGAWLMGAVCVLCTRGRGFEISYVVIYHVAQWVWRPFAQTAFPGPGRAWGFAALSIFFAFIFWSLTPLGGNWLRLTPSFLRQSFSVLAFGHIALSLALSWRKTFWFRGEFGALRNAVS